MLLADALLRARISQRELARRAGLSVGYVSRLVTDYCCRPQLGTALRLGRALGYAGAELDAWLVRCGHVPQDPLGYALAGEPELLEVARLLGSPNLPDAVRDALRAAIGAVGRTAGAGFGAV